MRIFLAHTRKPELHYELLSYDPETHVAVLRHVGDGHEVVDPNFWPEMVKRAGYTMQRME